MKVESEKRYLLKSGQVVTMKKNSLSEYCFTAFLEDGTKIGELYSVNGDHYHNDCHRLDIVEIDSLKLSELLFSEIESANQEIEYEMNSNHNFQEMSEAKGKKELAESILKFLAIEYIK